MSRYRWDEKSGKFLIWSERSQKWVRERKKAGKGFDFDRPMTYVPDISERMVYATETPTLITSRAQRARYERANGIREAGDFKRGEIAERRAKKVRREIEAVTRETGIRPGNSVNWTDFQ